MATDKASDVALVTVPEDLPVAPFADDAGLGGGTPDLTLSFVPAGGASVALHCTPGAVTGVGDGHRQRSGRRHALHHLLARRAERRRRGPAAQRQRGRRRASSTTPTPGYRPPSRSCPSQLVVGVADDLRSRNRVVHGWLGVAGSDAPNGSGAKVDDGRARTARPRASWPWAR